MSSARKTDDRVASETAIWQGVEFGSHHADLPLWEELAGDEGPVLELGAGAGRVALHLAQRGIPVTTIDQDAELVAELDRRALAESLPLTAIAGDFVELDRIWPEESAPIRVALAPLHVIQQVDPRHRPQLLKALADLLPTGAPFAAVVVDEGSLLGQGVGEEPPTPDMREVDGWVYSSDPLWVQVGEAELTIRRLRERVAPDGEIERGVHDELLHRLSPEELEGEAVAAGFTAADRRQISAGPREADSIAVILEAP